MPFSLFLILFLLLLPFSLSSPFSNISLSLSFSVSDLNNSLNNFSSVFHFADTSFFIDCGSPQSSTDVFNRSWLPDQFYSGGNTAVVSESLRFDLVVEKTLRYFPLSFGKKNCYLLPLPSGRYYIRTFTIYDNYDGKSHSPSFDVSVEGTLVFSWRSPWPENLLRDGSYSDHFIFINDGELDLCFYSIATDHPIIGSLEVLQVDPSSYNSQEIGRNVLLVNYGRLSCGSDQFGPGFTNHTGSFGWSWQSDEGFRSEDTKSVARSVTTAEEIKGVDKDPNFFQMKLYQTAATISPSGGGSDSLVYELEVDAKLDYLLWFHFAEIDSTVKKAGQRVFDLVVNDQNVSRIDIFGEVGGFIAYSLNYTIKNLTSTTVNVKLLSVLGPPIISGLENYAIVLADMATVPEQGMSN